MNRKDAPKHWKKTYSVNFYDKTMDLIDEAKGNLSRSAFIDDYMFRKLTEDKENKQN